VSDSVTRSIQLVHIIPDTAAAADAASRTSMTLLRTCMDTAAATDVVVLPPPKDFTVGGISTNWAASLQPSSWSAGSVVT
jgi:hypothetical protein